ncbi:MAG: NAD(P)/FAD-dependent oxidoreductase [Conexivisphaerales archaeon]
MQSKRKFDVVVIGAGPAGCSAAESAASKGMKVALLEQEDAVAMRVRTSGVTWQSDAEALGIPSELYHPIHSFRFFSPKGSSEISCSRDAACVLNVRALYQRLAENAADKGAEIFLGCRASKVVTNSEPEQTEITGVVSSERGGKSVEFGQDVLIDASGFHSFLTKQVEGVNAWSRFGVGAEYEAYVDNLDEDSWMLMVGKQYSPAGYAWVFPLGKKRARIGVGIGKPDSDINPADWLDNLLSKRPGPLADLGRIEPIEFHFGMVPNQGLRDWFVGNGYAMVGDAAGQVNPLVLEGIRFAIKYGRLCGESAADQLRTGKEYLSSRYEATVKNEMKRRIETASKVQSRWLGLDDEGWDREIAMIDQFSCDEFLTFIKADFTPSTIVRLSVKHPSMAARELFSIVRSSLGL